MFVTSSTLYIFINSISVSHLNSKFIQMNFTISSFKEEIIIICSWHVTSGSIIHFVCIKENVIGMIYKKNGVLIHAA